MLIVSDVLHRKEDDLPVVQDVRRMLLRGHAAILAAGVVTVTNSEVGGSMIMNIIVQFCPSQAALVIFVTFNHILHIEPSLTS